MKWVLALALAVALAALSAPAWHLRIADTLLDPISRIDAQDEAIYARTALRMAEKGDWLTPYFLGRYAFYKPPLLFWLAGLSAALFGASAFALRAPAIVAGAATVGLAATWVARSATRCAGRAAAAAAWASAAAAILLLSDHLWSVVAGLCLTDGLLTAFVTGSMFCLLVDSRLRSRPAFWGFAALTAAAILSKSLAGLLSLLILVAFGALAGPEDRPSRRRIVQACLATAALALPWYFYQLCVHPRWFWTEHFASEILTYGVASPTQTSVENQVLFYLRRALLIDPVLCVCALAAAPALRRAFRQRAPAAVLLVLWIAVVLAASFAWSYRNVTYLLPAVPAFSILAVSYGPLCSGRKSALATTLVLAAVFLVKAGFPAKPWGLALRPTGVHSSMPLLARYCLRGRGNELILVQPDDGFYSAVLPLPGVRYCFIDPTGGPAQSPFDLRYLGIVVDASQFVELDKWRPSYKERLKAWGLDSTAPIATAIMARSRSEIARMIAAHPESDYFLPEDFRQELEPLTTVTHDAVQVSADKFFLLSRSRVAAGAAPVGLDRRYVF